MAPPEGVAIVTGGTSYLGAAAARSLAPSHAVAITDLEGQEAEGRKLVAELGEDRAMFLTCDVRWTLLPRMLFPANCTGTHAQAVMVCSSPLRL
jgi:NAD(P)-dependent dehydrogenase (short-subunit alcohol dehydrogenase family)